MADSKPAEKSGGDGRIKLVSWNVNGLRATLKKDPSFTDVMAALDADVFAVQETKLQAGQVELDTPGYHQTWSYAERKGYSGTAVFSRWEPLQVVRTIGCEAADDEGRVCALEFDDFWFVDVYTPNAKQGLLRIDERMAWDERYRAFLQELDQDKPVITCGDFNVAVHRHVPRAQPHARGRLQLVELPLQRAQEQRRLAHRLLPGERPHRRSRGRRDDPRRRVRLRPLPRRARDRTVGAMRSALSHSPATTPSSSPLAHRGPSTCASLI